ncbi:MAG: hypothetical protein RMM31_09345 [Anaerolineae bacterium]|nr:hypothetical protein [Thermoflexales bacterium]MDW8396432.1 hypothetical protein [Anaerolineae bacterium]
MNLVTKTNLLARALCSLAVQVATFLLRLVTGGLSLFVMIVIAGLMLLLWWLLDLERKTAPSSSEDDETTPDYFEGTFDEYVEKLIGDIQDFGGGSRE